MILKLSPNLITSFPTQTGTSSAYTLFLSISGIRQGSCLVSLKNYCFRDGAESPTHYIFLVLGETEQTMEKALGDDERDWLCRRKHGFLSEILAEKPFLSEIREENLCSTWQVVAEDLTQAAFGQGWPAPHQAETSSGLFITISWAKPLGHHYSR